MGSGHMRPCEGEWGAFAENYDGQSAEKYLGECVSVKCCSCGQRLFDLVPPSSGMLAIKCQRCKQVHSFDLTHLNWLL